MDITIGLANTAPGVTRDSLLEWARRAEARGFPGVASLDRRAKAFEDAGCDELAFFPSSTDPQQVDLLADAIGL